MPTFSNTVKVEWLEDDPRDMMLSEDVEFTDGSGKVWLAPEFSIINGADIPEIMWSAIGSPFVGYYRRPSVIHDVYCVTRSEPHEAVHKMFHEAMLADGVSVEKALIMYHAVKEYGPKWDENGNDIINDQDHDVGDE